MGREEEEAMVEDEESSQCSSGCQSGWTLYLEHSGSAQQQCRSLPYHPADARRQMLPQAQAEHNSDEEEEDSMVSDASSGPPHRLRDDEEELLQVQGQITMLSQQRRRSLGGDHQCYDSGIGGGPRGGSVSGSRSLLSARSRSFGEAGSRKKRKAVLHRKVEVAMSPHRYGVVDDDDLHDTASSSAVVVASADAVEAMHLQQPSCDFLAQHCSPLGWPAV